MNPNGCDATNIPAFSSNSFHPGGVNVAFADGSVHFIKNSISSWNSMSITRIAPAPPNCRLSGGPHAGCLPIPLHNQWRRSAQFRQLLIDEKASREGQHPAALTSAGPVPLDARSLKRVIRRPTDTVVTPKRPFVISGGRGSVRAGSHPWLAGRIAVPGSCKGI